eukprot:CAMPEP_0202391558 /NCGR_PEP_ID=MMETSP1127-20130417/91899_1 /ASSEMBLY_ACC=CAM_ASM_000462 /TAXON_ID=3047 /ORGANISM="Dunaliella tertiolecta, Strain CCMP1320" /LENGTH=249 /DNA_ID=CAMNT_0048993995 /DNA_START=5175 /DNA_END=5924 /DNA_ORIENTATION=-
MGQVVHSVFKIIGMVFFVLLTQLVKEDQRLLDHLGTAVIQGRQGIGQEAWLVVHALPQVQHPVTDGAQELQADHGVWICGQFPGKVDLQVVPIEGFYGNHIRVPPRNHFQDHFMCVLVHDDFDGLQRGNAHSVPFVCGQGQQLCHKLLAHAVQPHTQAGIELNHSCACLHGHLMKGVLRHDHHKAHHLCCIGTDGLATQPDQHDHNLGQHQPDLLTGLLGGLVCLEAQTLLEHRDCIWQQSKHCLWGSM